MNDLPRIKPSHEFRATMFADACDELELRLVQRAVLLRISICALGLVIVTAATLAWFDPLAAIAFVCTIIGAGIFCAWPARQWLRNAPNRTALRERLRADARRYDDARGDA